MLLSARWPCRSDGICELYVISNRRAAILPTTTIAVRKTVGCIRLPIFAPNCPPMIEPTGNQCRHPPVDIGGQCEDHRGALSVKYSVSSAEAAAMVRLSWLSVV